MFSTWLLFWTADVIVREQVSNNRIKGYNALRCRDMHGEGGLCFADSKLIA
jgi:hypothetical protein